MGKGGSPKMHEAKSAENQHVWWGVFESAEIFKNCDFFFL